ALDLTDIVAMAQDWGGPILFGALAERTERVSGLVVLNTVVGPPKEGFRPTAFHRLSQTPVVSDLLFRGLGFPQNVLFAAQGKKQSIGLRALRAYRYPLRKIRQRAAPLGLARMVPDSPEHPSIAPLQRIEQWVSEWAG